MVSNQKGFLKLCSHITRDKNELEYLKRDTVVFEYKSSKDFRVHDISVFDFSTPYLETMVC